MSDRVKICVPFLGTIHPATELCCRDLQTGGVGCEWPPTGRCEGSNIAEQRNCMIDLAEMYTHWLFVDADIAVSPAGVAALLARRLPVVSAAYQMRGEPGNYTGGWFERPGVVGARVQCAETGCIRVDWVGAGCLLVRREVFESIRPAYFRYEWILDGASQTHEDIGFCMHAGSRYPIHMDCTVVAEHFWQSRHGAGPVEGRLADALGYTGQRGMSGVTYAQGIEASVCAATAAHLLSGARQLP